MLDKEQIIRDLLKIIEDNNLVYDTVGNGLHMRGAVRRAYLVTENGGQNND